MSIDAAIVWALTGIDQGPIHSWRDWVSANREIVETAAAAANSAGQPWPVPIPAAARPVGAAQWAAVLRDVLGDLGLGGQDVRPPAKPRPLTADERRLLADVPPHHVG